MPRDKNHHNEQQQALATTPLTPRLGVPDSRSAQEMMSILKEKNRCEIIFSNEVRIEIVCKDNFVTIKVGHTSPPLLEVNLDEGWRNLSKMNKQIIWNLFLLWEKDFEKEGVANTIISKVVKSTPEVELTPEEKHHFTNLCHNNRKIYSESLTAQFLLKSIRGHMHLGHWLAIAGRGIQDCGVNQMKWMDSLISGNHIEVRAVDLYGNSILHRAIYNKNFALLNFFREEKYIKKFPNLIHGRNREGQTVLMCACRVGDYTFMGKLLAQGVFADCQDFLGKTALMYACEARNYTAMDKLLARGVFADCQDFLGKTALMYACEARNYMAVGKLLLEGAFPDHQDVLGRTALMYACEKGCHRSMGLLLLVGASPDRQDLLGKTALMYACKNGGWLTALSLLTGHDTKSYHNLTSALDQEGKTALMYALDYSIKLAKLGKTPSEDCLAVLRLLEATDLDYQRIYLNYFTAPYSGSPGHVGPMAPVHDPSRFYASAFDPAAPAAGGAPSVSMPGMPEAVVANLGCTESYSRDS
jgi:ankyrin repeat protein